MLRLEGVSFRYPGEGGFALRIPALEIAGGEKVALIGPSGSGKTTLVSLISGILRPSCGVIRYGDFGVTGASDERLREFRITRIGFVFQEFFLLDYLNARENLLLPFALNPVLRLDAAAEEFARSLAARIGMADKLHRFPHELSQGERQRVAIGRAFVTHPPLVIADEPTANLDVATAATVMDLLMEDVTRHGRTFLMVTHDPTLFPRFDRVVDVSPYVSRETAA